MSVEQIGEMLALLFTGLAMLLFVIALIEMVSCVRQERSVEREIKSIYKKSSATALRVRDIADKTFLNQ